VNARNLSGERMHTICLFGERILAICLIRLSWIGYDWFDLVLASDGSSLQLLFHLWLLNDVDNAISCFSLFSGLIL
jgi:hypothetical protein